MKIGTRSRIRIAVVMLMCTVLLIGCSNEGIGFKDWLESPITDLSIGDLLFMLIAIGFITNS